MRLPYAFRISLRSLLRSPILFASAVIALGLGIAAPTTMFTIANGALRAARRYSCARPRLHAGRCRVRR
jgi:hypothetical protein